MKEVLMIKELSIVETDKVIHTVETDKVKQIVDVESSGKSADEIDNETVSFGGRLTAPKRTLCQQESSLRNFCKFGVGIKRLLDDLRVIAAQVCVTAAKIRLQLQLPIRLSKKITNSVITSSCEFGG
ncbi:hypothetical protein Tco_0724349 [Tanacetum coccineum]